LLLSFLIDFFCVLKYSKDGKIFYSNPVTTTTSNNNEKKGDDEESLDDVESLVSSTVQLFHFGSDSSVDTFSVSLWDKFVHNFVLPVTIIFAFGFPVPIGTIVKILTDPLYLYSCTGCRMDIIDFMLNIVCSLVYFNMMFLGLYAMRNEADPLGLFNELKMMLIVAQFSIIPQILSLIDPGYVNQQYKFNWEILGVPPVMGICYVITLRHVVLSFQERSQIPIRRSTLFQVTDTNNSNPSKKVYTAALFDINKMLSEPKARNALLEHAVNELSSENVVFVMKVRAWKSMWEKESLEKVSKLAINIFKEFVDRDSKSAINIPISLYYEAEKLIQPYIGAKATSMPLLAGRKSLAVTDLVIANSSLPTIKPPIKIFDGCEKECVAILETDSLPRFVKSDLFKERIENSQILTKIMKD